MSDKRLSDELSLYFCEGPWPLKRVLAEVRKAFPDLSDEELFERVVIVPAPVVWLELKPS